MASNKSSDVQNEQTDASTAPSAPQKSGRSRVRSFGHALKRTLITIVLLAVGAAIFFVLARANALQAIGIRADALPGAGQTQQVELTSDTVKEVVSPASQLLTTTYYYTNAETYRSSKELGGTTLPGTENVVIYTYSGTVSLGIDLAQTSFEVDNRAKTIQVSLPDVHVVANEIDQSSFEPQYESYSALNPITLQDAYASEDQLKQEAADRALGNADIMQQARANAESVIRDFLTSADATKDYTVTFTNDGENNAEVSSSSADSNDSSAQDSANSEQD